MHNLHYIRVQADTGEDAVDTAESEIMDWGNENNWRRFGGAISKSGTVYINDKEARWIPTNLKDLNERAEKLLPLPIDKEQMKKDIDSKEQFVWWKIVKQANAEFERLSVGVDTSKFDVWEHEIYSYQFDECGVTDLNLDGGVDAWIVFLDMHS